MREDFLSPAQFWKGWEVIESDNRFELVNEPYGLDESWRKVTAALPSGERAETDAFLAAMALAGGWSVATFDRGFRRFKDVVGVELL